MKRSIPASFAIAFLLAGALAAQPAGRRGAVPSGLGEFHKGEMNSACLDALGLSDAQKSAVRELRQELSNSIQPLLEQRRSYHGEIEAALEAANPDPTAIGRLVIADHGVAEQIRNAHEQFQTRFEALLTAEQLTTYRALRENGVCLAHGKHPR